MLYSPEELEEMETIREGQCCDCKIDTGSIKVWLCRIGGGVTIEKLINNKWITAEGSCTTRR